MKIYTKTGDSGMTGLVGNKRVSKADPLIEAIGTVDELNAILGFAVNHCDIPAMTVLLEKAQRRLFDIGAELASPPDRVDRQVVSALDVEELEASIDEWDSELAPLQAFILPGGTQLASLLHLARTVCRRAERRCIMLAPPASPRSEIFVFLNRLSDWLFVAARTANHRVGVEDKKWKE